MKTNPFYSGIRIINLPTWALIFLAVIFFLLSIISLAFHPYTRKKIRKYRELQLQDWKKDNPKKSHFSYEQTGMFLPAWQRAKYNLHLICAIIFLVGGFVFAFGNSLTTL